MLKKRENHHISAGTLKLQDWTLQDWTMTDDFAEVDIAGLDWSPLKERTNDIQQHMYFTQLILAYSVSKINLISVAVYV